jgi:hypothetical protein
MSLDRIIDTNFKWRMPDSVDVDGVVVRIRTRRPEQMQGYWKRLRKVDYAQYLREKMAGRWLTPERGREIYGEVQV